MRTFLLPVLLFASIATACRSQPPADRPLVLEPPPPPVPTRWTGAFRHPAVLVADEIFIEGPPDLVDHVALRTDQETTQYASKTVTEGLRQELVARPEMGVELRGQLDLWSLVALRRITVLMRPGEVPVTVRARGSAFWSAADGSAQKREPELVFRGLREQ